MPRLLLQWLMSLVLFVLLTGLFTEEDRRQAKHPKHPLNGGGSFHIPRRPDIKI